ncbi:NlpC/P60 family protein [Nonomuraea sp. NPDC050790]|uniref:NlpC/P60 family protein n=1 Tax=Nonomuraea sp. NPDC050790 TaxID=3364371 RepID=UPI0037B257BC
MMWLTLGGGFLATLSTVPAPSAECQVVITIPAPNARTTGLESETFFVSPVAREVKRVITLPAVACTKVIAIRPAPTHPPHPWPSTPITIKPERPTPNPKEETPNPTPRDESPNPTPRGETPNPTPRGDAPKPTLGGEAPKPKPKGEAPKPAAKGETAAKAALSKLGTPFSWGGGAASGATRGIGRGANTVGFDCSGLTLYAWSRAGVTLGHYTGTQFRQGRRVALSDLRKGDLLFFGGGTGDPTHVGLYLGDGIMIHAPKTGDVVRKTAFLKSTYYRSTYRGAVRPG